MGGLSKDAYLKKMSDMIRDLYVVNRHGLPSIVGIEFVSCTNRIRNGLEELRETIFDVADSLVIQGNRRKKLQFKYVQSHCALLPIQFETLPT